MNELELHQLLDDVRGGRLARREFVQRMLTLGVGVPLASAMLSDAGIAQTNPAPAYKPTRRGGGGVLRLLFWQGPTLLNPHFASGQKDQEGCRIFHEPLITFDVDANAIPVLAAQMPSRENGGVAADGRSVTWKLKQGVTWHDGKPFTADDVVFNWQFAVDPAAAAYSVGLYGGVKSLDKIDSHTVRFVFDKPTPAWALPAGQQLVPMHLFANYRGAKSREAPANLKPVGTGPYRFVDFKPGDLVVGELNPNYHEPNRPHFDRIEMKGGGDATSAARAVLQTGEFDYAWNLLVEDELLKRMEAGGKGRLVFVPGGNTEFIEFNRTDPTLEIDGEKSNPKSRHPLLSDRTVRQALVLLADRETVQQYVYGRTGVATANVLNNPSRFNSPNLRIETGIDKANALLDGAGWKRAGGSSDGLREKDGKKLKLLFQTSINPLRQKVQAIFKQSCAKAGIEVELKGVTASVFFSSDVANNDTFGKFHADVQMYAFSRTPDPARFMQSFVSWEVSSKANKWLGLNRGRWVSEEYDRAYRAAEVELDPVKRAALFIRMNDLVCTDPQVIPIVYRPDVAALLRGIVAPLSAWDTALGSIQDWYRET